MMSPFLLRSREDPVRILMRLSLLLGTPSKRAPGLGCLLPIEETAFTGSQTWLRNMLNSLLILRLLTTENLPVLLKLLICLSLTSATGTTLAGLTKLKGQLSPSRDLSICRPEKNLLESSARLFLGTSQFLCKPGSWLLLWLLGAP